MSRTKGMLAALFMLALAAAPGRAATTVVDLDTAGPGAVANAVAAGDSLYITNSGAAPAGDTVLGGGDWNIDGKLYLGFAGKDTLGGESIASDKITVTVGGDMNVRGASWIGKWETTPYVTFFPELPTTPSNQVELNVGGDLTIDISGGGFGAFMVGSQGTGSSTIITVAGDTVIKSGGNHFVAYDNGKSTLTTRTFNLDGGEIEVIGSSSTGYADRTEIITTAVTGNAVHLTNEADLTIMRGAVFDLRAGGDFLVENESVLIGGSGGGEIRLANGGSLIVSEDSTVNLWRGSLKVDGAGSAVDLKGTLLLGFHPSLTDMDGNRFTSLTGVDVTVAPTAKIDITDDFIAKALADHKDTDANAVVLEGTSSLTYDLDPSWTTGDKVLKENFYGQFVFTRNGDRILFKNLRASDYFADAGRATAAMEAQVRNTFGTHGVDARNVTSGLAGNSLGAAQGVMGMQTPGITPVTTDGSAAGDLNLAMLRSFAAGNGSFSGGGVSASLNTAFVNVLNANRAATVNSISMGMAGQVGSAISGRVAANNAALAAARDKAGSDFALASCLLECDLQNRIWAGALGMWEDADNRKGLSGYKYDSYGVIAGYDRIFGAVTAGAAFGYNGGDYEDKAAVGHDSDIENYSFALYATYNHQSGFFATLSGGYTYSDNDLNEFDGANWAQEDFHTDTWNVGATFGYDWQPTPCLTLTPSVGLSHVQARNSGHDVNYGGVSLLRYDRMKNHTTSVPVELAARYDISVSPVGTVSLGAKVGYSYNFRDEGIDGNIFMHGLGGATALGASGRTTGRHTFTVGTGITYTHSRFDFGLKYDYFGKTDYDAHRLVGTVGISF